jgi:hypothetical protein
MVAMKVKLANGQELEVNDVSTIDAVIDDMEKQLVTLHRMRKSTAELTGAAPRAKKKKGKKGASANGQANPTTTAAVN